MQDNEYILKGYRVNHTTVSRILRSLFMWHNETCNVWTHLLGSVFFLFLILYAVLGLGLSKTDHVVHAVHDSFYDFGLTEDSLMCVQESDIAESLEREWWNHVELHG